MNEKKKTLQEIVEQYTSVLLDIDRAEGDMDDDLIDALDEVEVQLAEKAERIAALIQMFESMAGAEKARAAKVAAHAKALGNEADRLRGWLLANMELLNTSKLTAGTYTLKTAKKPASVQLVEGFYVEPYMNIKTTATPDKKAIKADLQAGKAIEGARLITDGTRLVIT